MKKPVTKEAVLKVLVKRGYNQEDAKLYVEKEFDSAVKAYPEATSGKIADAVVMG